MPGFGPGTRLRSTVCTAEVIVTSSGEGTLSCGGEPMVASDARPTGPPSSEPELDRTLLGKRYRARAGTLEVLCVRQGPGLLELDRVPLELVKPKTLPASD